MEMCRLFWLTVCLIASLSSITVASVLPESSHCMNVSKLYNAIHSKNPDEDTIINILALTNARDREELSEKYEANYGISLVNDLRDKLTGKFEEAVVALMTPLNKYYAQEIRDSIYGKTDEKALIDTLCIFNHSLLDAVKTKYMQDYGRNMEYELGINTLGNFKNLMTLCIRNSRDRSTMKDLVDLAPLESFDDDKVIEYMTQRSLAQIHLLTLNHKNNTGIKLEDIIKDKFSGDFQKALLGIVSYALAERMYLVKRFHESLEENEVDHRSLLRLILMDKTDRFSDTQELYQMLYAKSLDAVIATKISSGSYRKFLQALLIFK